MYVIFEWIKIFQHDAVFQDVSETKLYNQLQNKE